MRSVSSANYHHRTNNNKLYQIAHKSENQQDNPYPIQQYNPPLQTISDKNSRIQEMSRDPHSDMVEQTQPPLNSPIQQCPQENMQQIRQRINADNYQPKNMLCFWLSFLGLLGLVLAAALWVPKEVVVKDNYTELGDTLDQLCKNPCGFQNDILICNQFASHNPNLGLILRNTNAFHQFALISLQFLTTSPSQSPKIHRITQTMNLTLSSIKLVRQGNTGKFVRKQELATRTLPISDTQEQKSFYFYGQKIQHFIGYYREVETQENILLVLKFSDPQQIVNAAVQPKLKAVLINPKFTTCVLLVRALCFGFSAAIFTWYLARFFKMDKMRRTREQKLVLVLGISVLLFNDPFYILSILFPNTLTTMLSTILLSQFLAYIYFLWYSQILIIQSPAAQSAPSGPSNLSRCTKKLPKFLCLYFTLYFLVVCSYFYYVQQNVDADTFIYHFEELEKYDVGAILRLWITINTVICLLLQIRILIKKQNILWRHYHTILFNLGFVGLLFFFGVGLGSAYTDNSSLLFIGVVAVNVYGGYLMYMHVQEQDGELRGNQNRVQVLGQYGQVDSDNCIQVQVSLQDLQITDKFDKTKEKAMNQQIQEGRNWSQNYTFK